LHAMHFMSFINPLPVCRPAAHQSRLHKYRAKIAT
jgi:hypothetical protein